MKTSSSKAPRASSNNADMTFSWIANKASRRSGRLALIIAIAALLVSCASPPEPSSSVPPAAMSTATNGNADDGAVLSAPLLKGKSRWVPVRWAELPGLQDDPLYEAWNAWIRSCEHPGPVFAPLCGEVRRLSLASVDEQRAWMKARLQPYRVETLQGASEGLLTSYYEPVLKASRQAGGIYQVPLYRAPATLDSRKPWFSRQDIDTLPEARAALKGREIAWVADPIDALSLQIQGSGRLIINETDGSQRTVRVAFAGSNNQPYRSVNQWRVPRLAWPEP